MDNQTNNFGAIIPLAWPDSLVNTSFKLMDPFFSILNLSKKGFYKVGHAAMAVAQMDGTLLYFDFGRYIAPKGKGRIRGCNTDPEITLQNKAVWQGNQLQNLEEILLEIAQNKHTHGEGKMYAGVHYIQNTQKALQYILQQQQREFISYGPYVPNGTNCSRFVAQTIAHVSDVKQKIKFLYPFYTTPSPLGNIFNSNGKLLLEIHQSNIQSIPIDNLQQKIKVLKSKVLFNKNEALLQNLDLTKRYQFNAPNPHENIPVNAKWFGGMGAGAWFTVFPQNATSILVKRQQKDGYTDYETLFELQQGNFNPTQAFEIVYGSNFQKTILTQNNQFVIFNRK